MSVTYQFPIKSSTQHIPIIAAIGRKNLRSVRATVASVATKAGQTQTPGSRAQNGSGLLQKAKAKHEHRDAELKGWEGCQGLPRFSHVGLR